MYTFKHFEKCWGRRQSFIIQSLEHGLSRLVWIKIVYTIFTLPKRDQMRSDASFTYNYWSCCKRFLEVTHAINDVTNHVAADQKENGFSLHSTITFTIILNKVSQQIPAMISMTNENKVALKHNICSIWWDGNWKSLKSTFAHQEI